MIGLVLCGIIILLLVVVIVLILVILLLIVLVVLVLLIILVVLVSLVVVLSVGVLKRGGGLFIAVNKLYFFCGGGFFPVEKRFKSKVGMVKVTRSGC